MHRSRESVGVSVGGSESKVATDTVKLVLSHLPGGSESQYIPIAKQFRNTHKNAYIF